MRPITNQRRKKRNPKMKDERGRMRQKNSECRSQEPGARRGNHESPDQNYESITLHES
jgi:hypothetical protein